jgi:aminoglycoside 6'-N-acetyltransferase
MAHSAYEFHPMTADHLPMIRRWLCAPHVTQWWGDAETQFALIRDDLAHPAMDQFIVVHANCPLAYLQCYDVEAWPENGFGAQPRGALGIDQFVGEPDLIGCGHGSAFIRAFADGLLAAGASRVVTDPDPANTRAIRAYEKAGLRKDRLVDTPDGRALLMVRDA